MHTESNPQRETALRKDTPSSLTTPPKVNHRYREIRWTYTETLTEHTQIPREIAGLPSAHCHIQGHKRTHLKGDTHLQVDANRNGDTEHHRNSDPGSECANR